MDISAPGPHPTCMSTVAKPEARVSLHQHHVQASLVGYTYLSAGEGGGCISSQNLLVRSVSSGLMRAEVRAVFDNDSRTELCITGLLV